MFAYYGYFGRARAEQIAAIRERVARIDALDTQLAAEQARLDELQASRRAQLDQVASRRDERARVLANLAAESRTRAQSLARLKTQQADLERLLRELARSIRAVPPPIPIPSSAACAAGSTGRCRAGSPPLMATCVPAACTGRVSSLRPSARRRCARWPPGASSMPTGCPASGLLAIIDHGSGYLSLYGYNDALRNQPVGTLVGAGDVIAAAGDTGGRSRPELYFEIRRAGKPVDPQPWFRSRRPG